MKNILIGADLTVNSENAFIRAIRLAEFTNARLHVLHVDRRLELPGAESDPAAYQVELKERLYQFVRARSGPGGIDCEVHLQNRGRTYEVVARYARKIGADLVVIGQSKRQGGVPGSVLLTTGQVVASSDCRVLVVTQPVSGDYRGIVLNAEMSNSTEKRVLSLVCRFGPDVHLTAVRRSIVIEASDGPMARIRAKIRQRRQARVAARTASFLQEHGLADERLSISETQNDPFDSLLTWLGEEQFDVVILTNIRRKLHSPEMRERLLNVVPMARCDALFLSG